MDAKGLAKVLGVGRAAVGVAMVAAPGRVSQSWVGSADAHATVPTRALGAREILLGFLAAHTAERSGVGARTVQSLAVMDAVDAVTTLAAARQLPTRGVVLTTLLAGGSAAFGLWLSQQLD